MNNFKKSLTLILSCLSLVVFSQKPTQGGAPAGANPMARMGNIGRVYGKIVDASTKKPIEFASVVILRPMGQGKPDSIIGGGLTLENGDFSIDKLPFGGIKVKVSFVGFLDFMKFVTLFPPDNAEMDLGDLTLKTDSKVLQSVEVTAQKAQMQLSLDKKTFNVDKNITATGGTAEDVLKNIPSVTLDADGNAKLRNVGTTIYVDGRPTMMSLNQIPSDQIESVEVISNPSAKFEAATTGGILNIVLKKNRKPGYNGFIGLGVGTGNRYNTTANLNVKQGRWNFSGFGSINASKNPTVGYTRRNALTGQSIFEQNTATTFDNSFKIARIAADYSVNNRNTITLAGNIVKGIFDINSDQDYVYPFATADTIVKTGSRAIRPQNQFTNYQLQTTWKKNFPQKGRELTLDATYGFGNSSNTANWTTTGINAKGEKLKNFPELVDISGGNKGQQLTAQLDYTNPINDSTKVEMGFRSNSNFRNQQTFFKQYNYSKDIYEQQNGISQNADITDIINAAYFTYTSRFKKGINYQVGLRYEQSKLDGKSKLESSPSFGYDYTKNIGNSLFPSIYLSKKIDKKNEIQLNFSRKIQRPNFMQLMPVIQNNDRQNIRIGNPKLEPEFLNKTEFNYNKLFAAHNWLFSAYFELETNTIKPFAYQSTTDTSVIISTFTNAKDETRYGIDNTLKLALSKNLDFTTNFNLYNITISSPVLPTVNGWGYDAKANLNYKLPKGFSVQLNGSYESDRVIPQGKRIGVAFADFAVKKSFFGGIANVTFSVNDVFDSRKERAIYNFNSFTQETMRRRDLRYYKLSLQMPFGKMDASIFRKAKDAKKQQGGQQDMDFGGQ
jgi:hypothetical protein